MSLKCLWFLRMEKGENCTNKKCPKGHLPPWLIFRGSWALILESLWGPAERTLCLLVFLPWRLAFHLLRCAKSCPLVFQLLKSYLLFIYFSILCCQASLVVQTVKNLPAMWEKILWRRERLPTPVFWPGEFHGLYSPWGRKESDTTEWLTFISLNLHMLWSSLADAEVAEGEWSLVQTPEGIGDGEWPIDKLGKDPLGRVGTTGIPSLLLSHCVTLGKSFNFPVF